MKQKQDTLRIIKNTSVALKADAKTVFPLLCPVKEVDWIIGWEDICTIVYTDSGIAEEACVFETDTPEEGASLWICSHYDAANTEITYIKHIIGKAIIKWDMSVRDTADGSVIEMVYNMTSTSSEGAALVRDYEHRHLAILLEGIQKQINDYVTK